MLPLVDGQKKLTDTRCNLQGTQALRHGYLAWRRGATLSGAGSQQITASLCKQHGKDLQQIG